MNITLLNIALVIYGISIVFLIGAVIVASTTILPIIARQATINDRLRLLREWFLQKERTVVGIGVIAIVALVVRFFLTAEPARVLISLLVLLFSIGYLRIALINRKIWHQEYKQKL